MNTDQEPEDVTDCPICIVAAVGGIVVVAVLVLAAVIGIWLVPV